MAVTNIQISRCGTKTDDDDDDDDDDDLMFHRQVRANRFITDGNVEI